MDQGVVDFVIAGAGSAGCVLANRLSADPNCRVVLLEAGGRDNRPIIQIPLLAGVAYFAKAINWGYDTEPEPQMNNRRLHWPRGRVIGGSSSINGMMYVRGQAADFDHWRQLGLSGWDWDSVLPFFKKSEGHLDRRDDRHGHAGPWKIGRAKSPNPLYQAFFDACAAAGLKRVDDFNGGVQDGFNWHDFNILQGRRQSTAVAFLRPALDRPNLRVITGAQATRVIFDGTRATGVEYRQGGARYTISPRREIVLSGGAINTPQLLLLSGIGPAADLQKFGIPVVNDLRGVGQTLQDHLGVYVQHQSLQPVTLYSLFRPDRAALGLAQVMLFGTGPFAALPLEAGAFVKTRPELETPDIQVSMVPGLNLETTRKGQGKHGFLIHIYQLRPESRGSVTLASPDPLAKPKMFANYLASELDRVTTRDGVKFPRKLFTQDSFRPDLAARRCSERLRNRRLGARQRPDRVPPGERRAHGRRQRPACRARCQSACARRAEPARRRRLRHARHHQRQHPGAHGDDCGESGGVDVAWMRCRGNREGTQPFVGLKVVTRKR